MINIKERNNPNWFVYVIILITGLIILSLEFNRKHNWFELILIFFIICFICVSFFLRNIEIIIDLSRLKVKFRLLGIVYRSIEIEFDKVQIDGVLTYDITFKKDNEDVLTFILDTDLEPRERNLLLLEMRFKRKSYQIGNRKNATQLFEKIGNACRKEGENIG